jgi:hypothetical protein
MSLNDSLIRKGNEKWWIEELKLAFLQKKILITKKRKDDYDRTK